MKMIHQSRSISETTSLLAGLRLSLGTLFRKFPLSISITWFFALCETTMIALAPLFIGYAIDGLLAQENKALVHLAALLGALVVIGVTRRIYDTRAYGTIRIELGKALALSANGKSVSATNARLSMGRELADFLEEDVPQLLSSFVQLGIALVILWSFHPVLSTSALGAGLLLLVIYALVHRRFFDLNGDLNQQMEQQVSILSSNQPDRLSDHFIKLRNAEVRISDTEAYIYGAMFSVLLGFIIFNLWFVAGNVEVTAGRMFSVVSYSWDFVEAAIILPATLQGWSRLSEIIRRINTTDKNSLSGT